MTPIKLQTKVRFDRARMDGRYWTSEARHSPKSAGASRASPGLPTLGSCRAATGNLQGLADVWGW